ncbi:MAG: DUF503 domain-containing protein [Candidatus Nitrohelix vancouverensis]|uniref:DUF503 domain-containing protein n=1 Tax=Candidatus Nitrohelix vancouverensis TaxID=2705534 RepID=A0A7T0C4H6_9BACT|nr:MAG: DUF503 domain-containing protein [Candidatus Nitrohelix vancouverensis]
MHVACCSIKFFLHGNRSLKEKRRVTRAIKDRLKNKFNVSVSEIGDQDVWQNLHLGIVSVGSDAAYLEGMMRQLISAIEHMHLAEIIDSQFKVFNMSDASS